MTTIDQFLAGKKILVFGLGRQGGGLGDANYLASHNYELRVTDQLTLAELGYDQTRLHPNMTLSLGGHREEDLAWADLIIQNPAVRDDHPLLTQARASGKTVASAISLFVKYSPLPTIGVTGTRGKTTTTTLISDILQAAYPGAVLCGGNLPGTSGLSLFDDCANKKYAVLELSSFQLHSFYALQVSPTYALITNLYPDHQNRYPDMESYRLDKEAIVAHTPPHGFVVYNQENEGSVQIASRTQAPSYPYSAALASSYPTLLPGAHNQSNIAAAIALTSRLGVGEDIIRKVIATFPGVPYRQQVIATKNGVTYINDTTATTPVAATIALRTQTRPTILLCGGESKNLPDSDFLHEIATNPLVKKVILLGSAHLPTFVSALKSTASPKLAGQLTSMSEAVTLAATLGEPGDVVLLSPGFASFDLFKNEFDRGEAFNLAVAQLPS